MKNRDRAVSLLLDVIARHRGEDPRALCILGEALLDIRVGARYLAVSAGMPSRVS